MALSVDQDPRRRRIITYIVLGVIFLTILGIALGVFRSASTNATASSRADQLRSAFKAAGLPQPSKDQIVRVLGDDGGGMCSDPSKALHTATLQSQMTNGAGGPGQRPIISDSDIVQGEVLAISIYCPDKLAEFTSYVKTHYKFDDVIRS
jgi:hypothetical protein